MRPPGHPAWLNATGSGKSRYSCKVGKRLVYISREGINLRGFSFRERAVITCSLIVLAGGALASAFSLWPLAAASLCGAIAGLVAILAIALRRLRQIKGLLGRNLSRQEASAEWATVRSGIRDLSTAIEVNKSLIEEHNVGTLNVDQAKDLRDDVLRSQRKLLQDLENNVLQVSSIISAHYRNSKDSTDIISEWSENSLNQIFQRVTETERRLLSAVETSSLDYSDRLGSLYGLLVEHSPALKDDSNEFSQENN